MAGRSWVLLLCLAAAAITGVLQARAQPDTTGFISIDCGLPGTESYVDNFNKLSYVPDADFIDTGTNKNISEGYVTPTLLKRYLTVRSFPDGVRNCYTLRSLDAGHKYLIRATFKYGNYDGLNKLPIFDIYVGVNFWTTVNITSAINWLMEEAIVVAPKDFIQVCLVNTGAGTPFISALDLRPLKSSIYPQAGATQGLVLSFRVNFGADDVVSYPDDPYDRIWSPWVNDRIWTKIKTDNTVYHTDNDLFEAPSKVMQTAATPLNASNRAFMFYWNSVPLPNNPSPRYIAIMHFAELQVLPQNVMRQFYVAVQDKNINISPLRPEYLRSNATYNMEPYLDSSQYNVIVLDNSTLPPMPYINAAEVFSIISTKTVGTDSQDVSAIAAIKEKYGLQKNWIGDACLPKAFAWNGLTCSYADSDPPSITGVNLSFSGLSGDITSSFAKLKAVQYLDLSHNNLTGSIPDTLSQLSSLTVLDVTGNQLNGSIPSGLLKRIQDGSLTLKYGNNPNICTNADSCDTTTRRNRKLSIYYVAIPVVLVVVIVLVVVLLCRILRRQKQGPTNNVVKPLNDTPMSRVSTGDAAYEQSSLNLENRRFTYKELETITNNFRHVLGRGGFGFVYDGFLEDGTQVAVKLRSDSSNQGVKEFLAEAQILTRIHHKNLVSMIGYCKDGEYMALVYEYMSEGTLQEHIAGNDRNRRLLTWRQRLRIALESAQGLEYLHKGCNPPLIHRDVKATNILLNFKLEAKIADFGLSKAFNRDNDTHISTNTLVGTPGYVDPEYLTTMQPTAKSDVFSFGVVLLELITGRPAMLCDPEPTNIITWARQRLTKGNIEDVVDPRMHGDHDVNSVWKVADIALKCTAMKSMQRPTMTEVVAQLQECLELEEGCAGSGGMNDGFHTHSNSGPYSYNSYATDGQSTDLSQSSTVFEMGQHFGRVPTMSTGPAAR